MTAQFSVFIGLMIQILHLYHVNTFLLPHSPTALTSLATTASAYASNSPEPMTHIANLRKKQQKAEQLQSEKLLVEDADLDINLSSENESDENEAAPSVLQKKFGKILTKIRFISSLAATSSSGDVDIDVSDGHLGNTNTTTNDDIDESTTEELDNAITNQNNNVEATSKRSQVFQKVIYPHSNKQKPLKFSFDINEKIVNKPVTEVDKMSENIQDVGVTSKLSQIGVFFAELIGSLVGLIYGAAVQITERPN